MNLLIGLTSLAIAAWILRELWRALTEGEIRMVIRALDDEFPRREAHKIAFWASVFFAVLMLPMTLICAVDLLWGFDMRWWL